jgi:hypothetical protein
MMMLLIKSTLVDRKIAAVGCSGASLLAHSGTATVGQLGGQSRPFHDVRDMSRCRMISETSISFEGSRVYVI